VALLPCQKLRNVRCADLQLQRCGDTIKRLGALACEVLGVLMQINESGSDYQTAGLDDAASVQGFGRYADNLSVADANIAHGIHAGFGIHDASTLEHEIVLLRGYDGGRCRQKKEKENQLAHGCPSQTQ